MADSTVSVESNIPCASGLDFLETVMRATPGHSRLEMCIQCGACGGSCPSGLAMDHTPRQLFALIRANLCDDVLKSNTPWYCVSCYYCTVRCPQEVQITDIMYTLKSMAIRQQTAPEPAGPGLATRFSAYVEQYGRVFEFGLAARQALHHPPAGPSALAELGLGLLAKGRLDLTPNKIDDLPQLQAILSQADEIERGEIREREGDSH